MNVFASGILTTTIIWHAWCHCSRLGTPFAYILACFVYCRTLVSVAVWNIYMFLLVESLCLYFLFIFRNFNLICTFDICILQDMLFHAVEYWDNFKYRWSDCKTSLCWSPCLAIITFCSSLHWACLLLSLIASSYYWKQKISSNCCIYYFVISCIFVSPHMVTSVIVYILQNKKTFYVCLAQVFVSPPPLWLRHYASYITYQLVQDPVFPSTTDSKK